MALQQLLTLGRELTVWLFAEGVFRKEAID